MSLVRLAVLLSCAAVFLVPDGGRRVAGENGLDNASSGTVPLVLNGNRIYAELGFVRPDGSVHTTLAFVDLGSPSTLLSPALFHELNPVHGGTIVMRAGDFSIPVDAGTVRSDTWLPFAVADGRKVEALLPAGVLQRFQVVLDYGARTLTLAKPGTLSLKGNPVSFRVNEQTGLIVVDASVDGKSYPVTIDCGSAYTWLRESVVRGWLRGHPEWERGRGAVGLSNMRMADDGVEAAGVVVRIPQIKLGTLTLREIGALGVGRGNASEDLMDWYSKKNPEAVAGWLGGNILKGFRITIDYPRRVSYWRSEGPLDAHDLDQVGLTLKTKGKEIFVSGVVTQSGMPAVEGVRAGDKLVAIDALRTEGASWDAIFRAMHGRPGEMRILVLEREGRSFTVRAVVTAF